ncbi:MAG: NUDIX hydrolase [Spirochaetes bacterium]|nr:NUDIX hydrolase [Spirochaetota bacterium]
MSVIYKGKIITVKNEEVTFPDGHSSMYEFVLHRGAVAIVPLIEKNRVLLVKQYRPVIKRPIWELPAGLIDEGETPFHAAKRELKEETGFIAGKLIKVGAAFSSPGFTDEKTIIFFAKDLKKTKPNLDPDEKILTRVFSIPELLEMIEKKKLSDAKTIMGILQVYTYYRHLIK